MPIGRARPIFGSTSMPARVRMSIIIMENIIPSASRVYEESVTFRVEKPGANGRRRSAISMRSGSLRILGASRSCILAASILSEAASFSFAAARSFAPPASCMASDAWRCAAANNVLLYSWRNPSARDTNASYAPSPATPKIIRSQPTLDIRRAHDSRRYFGTTIRSGRMRKARGQDRTHSASSRTTPITTIQVHTSSREK